MTDETPPAVESRSPVEEAERRGVPPWLKIGAVFLLLAGGVGYLLAGSGAEEAFVYSKLVHEVADDPAAHQGRQLRVEGDLKQGSVRFREDPCEWRFVLEKEGRRMPVEFPQCVVPDTFRDDMGISVVVEGKVRKDGSFLASQVIPRCPSKYEMKQKLEAGEDVPHDMPPASATGGGAFADSPG